MQEMTAEAPVIRREITLQHHPAVILSEYITSDRIYTI